MLGGVGRQGGETVRWDGAPEGSMSLPPGDDDFWGPVPMAETEFSYNLRNDREGLPCWSSGQHSSLSLPRAWIQSLVGELRFCRSHSVDKKKKKKERKK